MLPKWPPKQELARQSLMDISALGRRLVSRLRLIAGSTDHPLGVFSWMRLRSCFSAACIFLIRISLRGRRETSVAAWVKNLKAGISQLFDTEPICAPFSQPRYPSVGIWPVELPCCCFRHAGAQSHHLRIRPAGGANLGRVCGGSLLMAGLFYRMREGAWLTFSYFGMALTALSIFHALDSLAIMIVTFEGFFNAPSTIGRRW